MLSLFLQLRQKVSGSAVQSRKSGTKPIIYFAKIMKDFKVFWTGTQKYHQRWKVQLYYCGFTQLKAKLLVLKKNLRESTKNSFWGSRVFICFH